MDDSESEEVLAVVIKVNLQFKMTVSRDYR